MKKLLILVFSFVVSTTLLTACGGGSSGGGGKFVGTYSGTFTLTATVPGGPTDSTPGSTTVVINENGTVVVDPGTPGQFYGTISGNTFTANFPGSRLNEPGLSCTGSVTMKGNGSGNTFTGTFSGTVVCNGVTVNISGSFRVTRVASVSRTTKGVIEHVRQAIP